jgi:uncharacterized protein
VIQRTLQRYLLRDAGYYPILTLTGPRQSGKTTLARETFPHHEYVSLEELDQRTFAHEDPRGFLQRYNNAVIIDEIQRVPSLFSYIQTMVDARPSPGQFVLTGSQNFLLMESVSQSLAGRTAVLHLLPFERAELEGHIRSEQISGATLFNNENSFLDPWESLYRGFYPRIHDQAIPPEIWLGDYIRTYIERDVRTLVNIGDLATFERFLSLAAGRTGQILNYTSLANDCGIALDTAKRWLSLLITSFIVFLLPPHYRNFNKRVVKSPKLFFHDTGLACRLLGIKSADQARTHPQRGALFENLVVSECFKAYTHQRQQPPLYFWRDQTGHEIDLVIEEGDQLFAAEIKSGQTISPDMFDTLRWWSTHTGNPPETTILVYGGDQTSTRTGMHVRPWTSV